MDKVYVLSKTVIDGPAINSNLLSVSKSLETAHIKMATEYMQTMKNLKESGVEYQHNDRPDFCVVSTATGYYCWRISLMNVEA